MLRILLGITLITISCATVLPLPDSLSYVETTSYVNSDLNYSFDYPTGWLLHEAENVAILTTFVPGSLPNPEGIPMEHTKMDIYRYPIQVSETTPIESFIIEETGSIDCIFGQPLVFTIDSGGQAVMINAGSDRGYYNVTYAFVDIYYFKFITYGGYVPVQNIVQSLRVIAPTGEGGNQPSLESIIATVQFGECAWG